VATDRRRRKSCIQEPNKGKASNTRGPTGTLWGRAQAGHIYGKEGEEGDLRDRKRGQGECVDEEGQKKGIVDGHERMFGTSRTSMENGATPE